MLSISLCPIAFTEAAKEEILRIYITKNIPQEYGLRIGIEGGACSAVSYVIGFDKVKPKDKVYDFDKEIKVIIDQAHQMFLFGLEVHFISNEIEQGFEFIKT